MNGSEAVHRYHDGTKHHFARFARSLGYLDWASQPNPFRSFDGAAVLDRFSLSRLHPSVGDILRDSLGLSAWKRLGPTRWSLRVNPSSGNLHPTEAYVVVRDAEDESTSAATASVWHYAPDRHALEQRCVFDAARWSDAVGERSQVLIALTSIHWREAWKYGERAFRYCQHDLGHAIAAIAVAASVHGMRARLLPAWSHDAIAALTGIDRDEDYVEAEREEPGCLIAIAGDSGERDVDREGGGGDEGAAMRELIEAVRRGRWTGRASQLSEDHVQWTFIDEIAAATRDSGRNAADYGEHAAPRPTGRIGDEASSAADYDRRLILQRRSALAFDGVSSVRGDTFLEMLRRAMPRAAAPWNALWWDPRIHLALFVHRVDGIDSGLYLLVRNRAALDLLRAAFRHEFLWTIADETLPLYLLARGDCRALARRLSCDQDIAADGFFSLGMIAHFDASLASEGVSFYRHLFWESGVVGQILYLEAERAGARATGIGCFYDDPVHDVLGLRGHAFQTLYHFTVGIPVEDPRLTTEPGYEWER